MSQYDIDTPREAVFTDEKIGRIKIKINVSPEEFKANPEKAIIDNLSTILGIHNINVGQIKYLNRYYKGIQDILRKVRKDKSKINNIQVTNYAYQIIQFKKGFTVGKPIKYIISGEDTSNATKYLLRYNKSINKKSLDLDKYENIYKNGIAYTYVAPRRNDADYESEAPYEYKVLDNTKTCMVYSTDIMETPLFSMIITTVVNAEGKEEIVYTCYYDYKISYIRKTNSEQDYKGYSCITEKNPAEQPITEYCLNQDRIGSFEPILSQLNSLNGIRSNQLDDIEEFINAFIVFINQNPDWVMKNIDMFRDKRAIALKTNNAQTPADIKTIKQTLEHTSINQFYEQNLQDALNIVGVPMATSSTGQGVSGEAQTYGGGWENAQAFSSIETTYIEQFERQDLAKMLAIIKKKTNIEDFKNVAYTDIDIKYTINKSNNILVKAQAFKYFIDAGSTWEIALELADACDDSHLIGEQVEKHIQEKKEREMAQQIALEQAKSSQNNDIQEST